MKPRPRPASPSRAPLHHRQADVVRNLQDKLLFFLVPSPLLHEPSQLEDVLPELEEDPVDVVALPGRGLHERAADPKARREPVALGPGHLALALVLLLLHLLLAVGLVPDEDEAVLPRLHRVAYDLGDSRHALERLPGRDVVDQDRRLRDGDGPTEVRIVREVLGPELEGVNDVGLVLYLDDAPAPTPVFRIRMLVFSWGCSLSELSCLIINHYDTRGDIGCGGIIYPRQDRRFAAPFRAYDQEPELSHGRFCLLCRCVLLSFRLARPPREESSKIPSFLLGPHNRATHCRFNLLGYVKKHGNMETWDENHS